jgi:3-deoxy-D-manno-octulosonic-acid transferase
MDHQGALTGPRERTSRADVVRVGAAARLKWRLFRAAERISDLRGNATAGKFELDRPATLKPALWVFVSTIGELNAIEPFLRQLAARLARLELVLITDHPHYRETYAARYPAARICVTHGHGDDARELARHCPPRLVVVAEIPCLPSDAPCRFSYAFLLEAKAHGACALLVNGWLYHYAPACRMDALERSLFARDYLRAFDRLCVQTDEARQRLIAAGADPERTVAVGNIKFDSMQRAQWRALDARSPRMLGALLESGRSVIVAGCVTGQREQQIVLDAFVRLRADHPHALLVLAPRHPEVTESMRALADALRQRGLDAHFRSALPDAPLAPDAAALVLDTIGDLRDFYAAATVAHVGVDHNVLEPLAFGKAVSVLPGWEATFPSFPVYQLLHSQDALMEADDAAGLAAHWRQAIADAQAGDAPPRRAQQALERARGAVERHFAAIDGCLAALA